MSNYVKNNINSVKNNSKFKCYDCNTSFNEYNQLKNHVGIRHSHLIPENESIDKYIYDNRTRAVGTRYCVICKKGLVTWDQSKLKYNRYCSGKCIKANREIFKKRMMKIYKKTTLLDEPAHQSKMLANRKISGIYTFKTDGEKIGYICTYELDFLKYLDDKYKMNGSEIISGPLDFIFYYYYENIKHFYIPDFYIPEFNLLIEVKDGSEYPKISKAKSLLKDQAVIEAKKCNYIKVVDKKYDDFDDVFRTLKEQKLIDSGSNEFIYIIPKTYKQD